MKFPKHRANVFIVVREDWTHDHLLMHSAVLGVFPTPEGADAYSGACEQEWLEKMGQAGQWARFDVRLSTYYDE